jgi:hypothetical protein
MTHDNARRLALLLLGIGALASAALATGRLLMLPAFGVALSALFLLTLLLVVRNHRFGRALGMLAVSALAPLSMMAMIASADPDTGQGTDAYGSDWLYLAVASAAAYWIIAVAILRRIGESPRPGNTDHA